MGGGVQASLQRDIDGGAAWGALPHFVFGAGPMVNTSFPPPAMSAWLNHGLSHGFPFSVAESASCKCAPFPCTIADYRAFARVLSGWLATRARRW